MGKGMQVASYCQLDTECFFFYVSLDLVRFTRNSVKGDRGTKRKKVKDICI